jgi:hypothetical protein
MTRTLVTLLSSLLMLGGGNAAPRGGPAYADTAGGAAAARPEDSRMWIAVGERRFAVTLADNEAARAFVAMLPLTMDMPDLNGNEKHAELPRPLPTNTVRPGTIRSGDLMLYGTTTMVIFYLTFGSSYSYTRIGRVDDPSGLAEALGRGEARVRFYSS